ncbi:hypothetical protein [Sulfitobacter sp. R18_1]|uniref:hypothetical protein n=1 Tax=Sulfitobacter sp. R18_1 TaxID=2821104 RepID=UPI001ADC65CD|nr:hypothetical protein [Sulfitobacter sp. R18_1]MBO9428781.1 hypothetical protein [Sulfitobacter sp. R18_1]
MARTHRKRNFPQFFFSWTEEDVKEWEDNLAGRDGKSFRFWNPEVKAVTRRERRRDWKRAERQIMKIDDYEEVDVPRLEKKYLGEIWFWD